MTDIGISSERQALVDRARESWTKKLIDISRRNNLLYFRELKTGTLNLSQAPPEAFAELLQGHKAVPLSRLLLSDGEKAVARAREIDRRALTNREERGVETLFLALGMATWSSVDDSRPPSAAVLLMPMTIEFRGRENRSASLRCNGDLQVNLVLLHVLEQHFGCTLLPERLLENMGGEDGPLDLSLIYHRLQDIAAPSVPGFRVEPKAILGNFSYLKMAMVKDLREFGSMMAQHDLIAAIAGDRAARNTVKSHHQELNDRDLDSIPPDAQYLVLDADSSQQRVIAAALKREDGVIQGPPGTGKSQTIANLIVSYAAEGKRVLFVAEKRAALEVVLQRLEQVDLSHLALDLHGATLSRREIMEQFRKSLSLIGNTQPPNIGDTHLRLIDRRQRLNDHAERINRPRQPSNLSIYKLQGQLLRDFPSITTVTRWRGGALQPLTRDRIDNIKAWLREASAWSGLFRGNDPSPWVGAKIETSEAAQSAMDTVGRLGSKHIPALKLAVSRLIASTGLKAPDTINEVNEIVALLRGVSITTKTYENDIWAQDLARLAQSLEPAQGNILARWWANIFNATYRDAQAMARSLRHDKTAKSRMLADEILGARDQLDAWRTRGSTNSPSSGPPHLDTLAESLQAAWVDLEALESILRRQDLKSLSLDELHSLLGRLAADTRTPMRLQRIAVIEQECATLGALGMLEELLTSAPNGHQWPERFEHAWLASCLEQALFDEPTLIGFQGHIHSTIVNEFCDLDKRQLKLAAKRVRRAHAEQVIAVMNDYPDEEHLVRREAEKSTRHLPLRTLLSRAPHVLTTLRPCWMASPLSVSQLLSADQRYFDVVLFDEASQIQPEDAVAALLRAEQAIVAGDRHQLPPTTFFASGEEEDDDFDDMSSTEGFESLLDLMTTFMTPWSLDWHYRSRDEALIAFSNHNIYGGRLITFPGSGGAPAISHELVSQTAIADGEEDSVSAEVRRLVELAIDHAKQRPHETLGVITMGIKHALRVEAALDDALRTHPELESFFNPQNAERFFVKNLERVQGDERDAIILSIGYGKDRSGKLPYRFGPLLSEGGERRLNVAITRARRRLTLVSSFDHTDMNPERSQARGVVLLRNYFQYAASQGRNLGDARQSIIDLNPFEADVYDTLTAHGIPLQPQWGVSKYRIDFVAQHPTAPGRFVLAIECDGATYHSAPTARDRDRLRQQLLEGLGWQFHRIWSTDWFNHREAEVERALTAYHKAVKLIDEQNIKDIQGGRETPPSMTQMAFTVQAPSQEMLPQRKGKRPFHWRGGKIDDYRQADLIALLQWIKSDGRPRSDNQLIEAVVNELGFQRLGSRIKVAIQEAIDEERRISRSSR